MKPTSSIILISVLAFVFQLFLVTESNFHVTLNHKMSVEEFQISAQASPITKEGLQKIVDFTIYIPLESKDLRFNFNSSIQQKIVIPISHLDHLIHTKNHRYLEFRSLLI